MLKTKAMEPMINLEPRSPPFVVGAGNATM
jgi:hypothetical protein